MTKPRKKRSPSIVLVILRSKHEENGLSILSNVVGRTEPVLVDPLHELVPVGKGGFGRRFAVLDEFGNGSVFVDDSKLETSPLGHSNEVLTCHVVRHVVVGVHVSV